jgi:hypothetical protein
MNICSEKVWSLENKQKTFIFYEKIKRLPKNQPAYVEELDLPNSCGLETVGPNLTFQATMEHPKKKQKNNRKKNRPRVGSNHQPFG